MRGEEGEGDEWGGGGGIKGGKGSFVRGLVGCVNERVQRWKKSNGPCREKKKHRQEAPIRWLALCGTKSPLFLWQTEAGVPFKAKLMAVISPCL